MQTLERLKKRIVFLSTYPPRACGIATFTQDLAGALAQTGKAECHIAAISDDQYDYPDEVLFSMNQQDPDAYPEAAGRINQFGADALMIEHEYGIYGGRSGEYLLKLTGMLQVPYFVTLHTVLPRPNKKQREIIQSLAAGCKKLVTMSFFSVRVLEDVYGVDPHKIVVIPHGVPRRAVSSREVLKKQEGLAGRFIVSTFGLLSPSKGLEYGIDAVARVARKHPELLYLILGQTHPVIKSRDGEQYREKLENAVQDYGISENVRFVNRYLTKEEIIRYLSLSDIYMTPYLGREQAVSGTLAYAVGYGRVIVSTPYPYATEMLAEGQGLLAKFHSSASLAKCILQVIRHPEMQAQMEKKTAELGKSMMWDRVAENYLDLFETVISEQKGETA